MKAFTYIEHVKFALMVKPESLALITLRFMLEDSEEAYRVFENILDGVIKIAIQSNK